MAAKGTLSFAELHVEKLVLGLAAAFTIALLVYYLMGPNTIEYGGRTLAPDELDAAIAQDAENLDRAIERAEHKVKPVEQYARKLEERFRSGLFAAGADEGPAVRPQLTVASALGKALPPLPGIGSKVTDLELAPILRPSKPVCRTGISLVYREQARLGEDQPDPGDSAENEPVEASWVSIAGWLPREAQKRAMTANGYEGYRARVYVVGVEAQRQEMTASGEYSAWEDVEPSLAMPRVAVPTPAIDDRSGDVLNQAELDASLDLLKANQLEVIQPEFYDVIAGDFWSAPPLDGLESELDEEEDEEEGGGVRPEPTRPTPRRTGGFQPGGRGARPGGFGPPGGFRPPGGVRPSGAGRSPTKKSDEGENRREAQKEIREQLAEAKKVLKAKDWSTAEREARDVKRNQYATRKQKKEADRIIKKALKGLEREQGRLNSGPRVLVTNPKGTEADPAVWFHDDSVEPGKTYRFRLRVKLWNRYVGKRENLANDEDAEKTVLVGEWSLPSDPVTVAPKTHFFVRGQHFGDVPAADVDVFTWYAGEWYKESFNVRVGDVIGDIREVKTLEEDEDGKPIRKEIDFSTGAVVLDLQLEEPIWFRRAYDNGEFNYSETKSVALTYVDAADGQVKQRIDRVDREDPRYKELKEEIDG
jgi:hypothetical protein